MSSSSKRLAAASLHRILQSSGRERPPPSRTYNSMFECFTCQGLMLQPVCLPCGHSLCKTCLVRPLLFRHTDTIQCRECRKTFPLNPVGSTNKDRKPTILLQNSFAKWFPEWVESCRSREEGNLFAKEGDYPIAVQCYSKALATGIQWNLPLIRSLVFRDHLSIKTTWSCPKSACTIDFNLCKETTSL